MLLLLLSFMFVIIHIFITCYVIHSQTIDNMFLLYYLVYSMFYNVIGILLYFTNSFYLLSFAILNFIIATVVFSLPHFFNLFHTVLLLLEL